MSAASRNQSSDVVVIGAGISGLRAAQLLARAGLGVIVVESRNRTGGRLLSVPVPATSTTTAVDLGASWCWPGEDRVLAVARELDVELHSQHIAGDAMYDDPGGPVRLDGNPIDAVAYRFSAGADALTDRIAISLGADSSARSDIWLDSHVQSITTGPAGAHVRGTRGTEQFSLSARHVIVAVAPAIAIRSIEFEPALDAAVAALAAATPVWMGSTTKVVVTYPTAFWRNAGLSGAAVSHRGPLREIHDLSGPNGDPAALFGFGSSVEQTIREPDVVEQLVRLFGADAAVPDAIHIIDWRPDIAGIDGLTDYQTYGHRLFQQGAAGGIIHWSSTETGSVNPGHIEGALQAAERAVKNIMSSAPIGSTSH